ncbi:hypothetical protein QFZ53_000265 [Microbacterium natoriense]|uniref:Uncharacterized protein n=1 Tax=Microbacterium natoriense TaxID=284570 RepID=A0AAW8ET20_9MICO|nr:hypothetical protein [Microbacterium natoriense]MDQ0646069.1 hypothetical protein [Microbacterium natoriense]
MQEEAPVGHVVHLVRSFDDDAAPSAIGFGTRVRPRTRIVLWMLVGAAAIGTVAALTALWTSDAPWWFSVIFTVMPTFFIFGCGVALRESARLSRREAHLVQEWARAREHAKPIMGRVSEREVSLTEHGGVSAFTLTVAEAPGPPLRARWHRSNPENGDATLLQTQVPPIRSRVRIWSVGMPDAHGPVIVEAIDPSVVP